MKKPSREAGKVDVELPVKVGRVTQQVLLSIIEDLGPYNAIMGHV